MKKTLFGVLAILLVLTMVFGGTLAVSADDEVRTSPNAGTIKDATGIIVDGKMDEAYKDSPRLDINMTYGAGDEGIYTRAVAYALWSSEESVIYFYVIVNDIDVAEQRTDYGWDTDGVELFLKRGNDMKLDYTPHIEGKFSADADGDLVWPDSGRGRQYRIHGYAGDSIKVNAFSAVEFPSGYNWAYSYAFDPALGRLDNKEPHYNHNGGTGGDPMVSDTYNEFGWYEGGWGHYEFDGYTGSAGYAVEFKIKLGDNLTAGEQILFDLSICDQFAGQGATGAPWYASYYRLSNPSGVDAKLPTGHDAISKYDYLVLGSEKVTSTKIMTDEELYNYGREDAMYPAGSGEGEDAPAYSKTDPAVLDREPGNAPKPAGSSSTATTPAPGTTAAPAGGDTGSSGGCGSSIVLSSSVAMLALVGAAGAFAFRKRDEE